MLGRLPYGIGRTFPIFVFIVYVLFLEDIYPKMSMGIFRLMRSAYAG